MINVTKCFLPPIEEYTALLQTAWDRAWLTNNGPLAQELERKLAAHLGVKHVLFCTNGTVVLQMALKAFGITGEVITTPFSYVATTNAVLWENCTPVFVDIEPESFCIDAAKVEAAITPNTQAVLATHVYGYPCAVEELDAIGKKHNVKIIYDGAHAFDALYKGRQLLAYGDLSTCSFHATKLYHTVEGGCIVTDNDQLAEKLKLYRSFGHIGDEYFDIGINGKNSEFHAAMGLCNLNYLGTIKEERRKVSEAYDTLLKGLGLQQPIGLPSLEYNYAYYPVVFPSEESLLKVKSALQAEGVNTRRYFYPSLNRMPFLQTVQVCPVAESIALRVLCLPLYYDLPLEDVERICAVVTRQLQNENAVAKSAALQ